MKKAFKDSAVGLAQKNIYTLAKHRLSLLEELHCIDVGSNLDAQTEQAYLELELAFLKAVRSEADRAINFDR